MKLAGTYGLRSAALMEWRKLRTVRSTYWTLLIFTAGMVGVSVADGASGPTHPAASYDPTQNAFGGLGVGQLAIGILGILMLSSEFTTGSIRATFAAVPRRGWVLAAKATVIAAVTLATGEVLAFAAFAAFPVSTPHGVPHASLGQPGVLRAVLLAGAYPCMIALIGLGLAAAIRHTVGAISTIVVLLFVLPLVLLPLGAHNAGLKFLPWIIALDSLAAVKPVANSLSAGAGFGMLCLYAAVALVVGGLALIRRDA